MNYSDTLDFLFSQLPMYQRMGKAAYKANLDNTHLLMKRLNQPHQSFKSIHVGGTNGKGSCSHMLASILQEEGYKVGLYTSPHLVDFRERIRINGNKITEDSVVDFVNKYKTAFEQIDLSFFEWTVGLCFDHFRKEKVDIAIVEVGMGGRLDSTNVITPLASIITNIGLDHTQFLGETKEKIAVEKAGIIKPGVPIIIGEAHGTIKSVFLETADKLNAPISFAQETHHTHEYKTDLLGSYQANNLQTVLTSIPYLKKQGFPVADQSIKTGLEKVVANTHFLGRWQVLSNKPTVICDTGHNEEGIIAVLKQLKKTPHRQIHFVLGMVNDKNTFELLKLFPSSEFYYFCAANIPRALPAVELMYNAEEAGLKGKAYESVAKAYKQALASAADNDIVFIGGSTFVVADFLQYTMEKEI